MADQGTRALFHRLESSELGLPVILQRIIFLRDLFQSRFPHERA